MSKLKVTWEKPGDYESFKVYAQEQPFTIETKPEPIATGLTDNEYFIQDPTGTQIHVMVSSNKGAIERFSDIKLFQLKRDLEPEMSLATKPWAFYKLNELTGNFLDSSGNGRHLTASINALRGVDAIDPTLNKSAATLHTNGTEKWIGKRVGTLSLGNILTVMMWLDIPDSTVSTYGEFFKIGNGSQGFSLGFNNNTNNGAFAQYAGRYLLIGQNGVAFRPSGFSFSNLAQKVHLTVVWSGSTVEIFVNGAWVNGVYVTTLASPMDTINIGTGEIPIEFKLPIARLAIFNKALSIADIAKIASITPVQS